MNEALRFYHTSRKGNKKTSNRKGSNRLLAYSRRRLSTSKQSCQDCTFSVIREQRERQSPNAVTISSRFRNLRMSTKERITPNRRRLYGLPEDRFVALRV